MFKGVGIVYNNSQFNCNHPTFVIPQRSVYTTVHVTTGNISALPNDIIQSKTLSIPNTTNKLDTSVNIYEASLFLKPPENKNRFPLHQEQTVRKTQHLLLYALFFIGVHFLILWLSYKFVLLFKKRALLFMINGYRLR